MNTPEPEAPKVFTAGYAVTLAAASLLLVIGLTLLFVDVAVSEISDEYMDAFHRNRRFISIANIVLSLLLACAAAYTKQGSRNARRVLAAFVALAVFVNLAGVFIGIVGLLSFFVVIVLAVAMWMLFRPASNEFVAHRRGDIWRV